MTIDKTLQFSGVSLSRTRRELSSTTAPTAAAAEAPTTALPAAPATLAFAMKRIGTDVADRGLQGIGLLGA